jgi:hypothetical protein
VTPPAFSVRRLHRQSTGALTSRAAFPLTAPTFAIAWMRSPAPTSTRRLQGTRTRRPAARDGCSSRSCIRGEQQRDPHYSYPCIRALWRSCRASSSSLLLSPVQRTSPSRGVARSLRTTSSTDRRRSQRSRRDAPNSSKPGARPRHERASAPASREQRGCFGADARRAASGRPGGAVGRRVERPAGRCLFRGCCDLRAGCHRHLTVRVPHARRLSGWS